MFIYITYKHTHTHMRIHTYAGKSPIMFNEGQANPYGAVQFAADRLAVTRAKRTTDGLEVCVCMPMCLCVCMYVFMVYI